MQTGPRENGLTEFGNKVDNNIDAITLSTSPDEIASDAPHDSVNGHTSQNLVDLEEHDEAQNNSRPAKRRKLAAQQSSAPRPISPPWRKIAVDGPTSFIEGGRRKSSRTNFVPLELQPPANKRQTRATVQHTQVSKGKHSSITSLKSSPLKQPSSNSTANGKRPSSSGRPASTIVSQSSSKTAQLSGSVSKYQPDQVNHIRRSHKKKVVAVSASSSPVAHPHQTRRAGRALDANELHRRSGSMAANGWHGNYSESDDAEGSDEGGGLVDKQDLSVPSPLKRPRLNLKVRIPTIMISHPEHVPVRRRHTSFQDWFRGDESTVGDGIPRLMDEDAKHEADLIKRMLKASQPDGVLSQERCSRYLPERQDEPPQQYAHQDYMVAAVIDFQRRLNREHNEHKRQAKRVAELVQGEWRRRQEKFAQSSQLLSHEPDIDIEREVPNSPETYYRSNVCAALRILWERATAEIQNQRRERWRQEQQRLGREKLNKVLEKSTRMLHKRSTAIISSSEDESDSDSGSEHGSQSPSPVDCEDDELTQDQLRKKYDNIASITRGSSDAFRFGTDDEDEDGEPKSLVMDRSEPNIFQEETPASVSHENGGNLSLDLETRDVTVGSDSVDQIDNAIVDDTDASTDMDDDMGDSDEGSADSGNSDEYESETFDSQEPGLLGFFPKEILVENESLQDKMDIEHDYMQSGDKEHSPKDDLNCEANLIPDATQVQTPAASNNEEPLLESSSAPGQPNLHRYNSLNNAEFPGSAIDNASPGKKASSHDEVRDPIHANIDLDHHVSLPTTPVSNSTVRTPVPFLLRGTLREYQHVGLDWLAKLYADRTNGILADEMGLGKTIQTIALLGHLAIEHETWGPHLIVVPTSVMLNWEMEFKKFLPGFKVLTYYGTIEERRRKREGWMNDDKWNVWITSYALVVQDHQIFRRRDWHYMVLDEAHNIKNFRSQRWQTLLNFKTRARLLLTGTPLQNNLTELWSLLFFIMPSEGPEKSIGGFAGLQEFSEWFREPVEQILEHGKETMDEAGQAIVRNLHHTLRPYILRRLKADVEKQMPGKYEHIVYCKLSKRQRELYQGFLNRAETKAIYASGNHLSMMNCIMQLRKVCCHPDLFETRQIVTSFAMPKSAVADFEIKELLVRRRLLQADPAKTVDLGFINLLPGANEPFSALETIQKQRIGAQNMLRQLFAHQWTRLDQNTHFDGTSVESTLAYLDNIAKRARFESIRHVSYCTMLRSQRRPIYSQGLLSRLHLGLETFPLLPPPVRCTGLAEHALNTSASLDDIILNLPRRSETMQTAIQKFACVTPKVVATDILSFATSQKLISALRPTPQSSPIDPFHDARMRLSIAFPDKRLLQYDCGKLQSLDTLLRRLQAGGHRALVFTQMTKVLDVLEQFLNIHGHRYLRLDGGTKIEQRQILTDRFNDDERITVFILSTRSGGLGINLTGADSVIFYDSDWNPAMDKQCQDRSHRIGQTRDVHIYRLVSESTVEVNIMRRARQKTRLDEVVIQEGQFNTDHFQGDAAFDISPEAPDDGDTETNAALDRVLGGRSIGKVFDEVEDKEDVAAAKIAEKEMLQTDAADLDEQADGSSAITPKTPGPQTPGELMPPPAALETVERTTTSDAATSGLAESAGGLVPADSEEKVGHIDDFVLRLVEWEFRDVPYEPDPEFVKKKKKKGEEHKIRRKPK